MVLLVRPVLLDSEEIINKSLGTNNFSPKFLANASNKHFLDSVTDGGARERN